MYKSNVTDVTMLIINKLNRYTKRYNPFSNVTNHNMTPKPMSHNRVQQEIYNHIWNNYPEARRCFWHTPNEFIPDTYIHDQCKAITKGVLPQWLARVFEGYKKALLIKKGQRKACGVLAGVTDLVLYWRGVLLMMDVKLPGDSLSDAQNAFIAANEKQGGIFVEINTVEQGKRAVDNFFNPVKDRP